MWLVVCILVYLCLKFILGVEELKYCNKVLNVLKISKFSYSFFFDKWGEVLIDVV